MYVLCQGVERHLANNYYTLSLIKMNVPISSLIVTILINLIIAEENNVCPTFKDYHTIKTNPKCWYDVAADLRLVRIFILLFTFILNNAHFLYTFFKMCNCNWL